jgi:hypothetical protein
MKTSVRALLLTGLLALSVNLILPTSARAGLINDPGATVTCTENCPPAEPTPTPTTSSQATGDTEAEADDDSSLLIGIYSLLSNLPDLF